MGGQHTHTQAEERGARARRHSLACEEGAGPLALGEGRSHRGLARRGGATEWESRAPATRRGPTGENRDAGVPEQVGVTGISAPLSSSSWASGPTEASKRKEGPKSRLYASLQKLSLPRSATTTKEAWRWTCTL